MPLTRNIKLRTHHQPVSNGMPANRASSGFPGYILMAARCLMFLCFLSGGKALALGPHELLVLANRNAPSSLVIARDYAALRHIPDCNVIALDLPPTPNLNISSNDFANLILMPAQRVSRERGIDDHILAWVYSTDFPIRTTDKPPLSLQGITFLRGKAPESNLIASGLYASPLFAGPDAPSVLGFPPQSLDVQSAWLGNDMPLPSMMLGYIGMNGNTREEITACLRRGAEADGTAPDGLVCLVTNADVRSMARQWEYAGTVKELAAAGISAIVTNIYPLNRDGVKGPALIGVMTGAADIPEAAQGRFNFLPGAVADHLTSFGAAFDCSIQTKATDWLRGGATASAGTVTEPMSYWAKFPHARLFAHRVAGCTLLESYFQAVRSPLQLLILGDPLSSPWMPRSSLEIRGLSHDPLTTSQTIHADITSQNGEVFNRFLFLVDGKTLQALGKSSETHVDPAKFKPGKHKLRVVAYKVGSVRSQIFAEDEFEVK